MTSKKKLLIFGGSGQIGSRAAKLLKKHFKIIAPTHRQLDVTDYQKVEKYIHRTKPDQILYAAGFTNIDDGPNHAKEAFLLNAGAVAFIAHQAKAINAPLYYLSTEVVFDGTKTKTPYHENDQPNPLSFLATTKRAGELITLDASKKNCILRLIICYSANYPKKLDLARLAVERVKKGQTFTASDDQEINPIYADHLIAAIKVILKNQATGVYHLGATDYTTPYQFAKKIIQSLALNDKLVKQTTFKNFSKTRPEPRPQHEWLSVKKFERQFGKNILHSVDKGIKDFTSALKASSA